MTDTLFQTEKEKGSIRGFWDRRWAYARGVAPLLSALLLSFAFPRFHFYWLVWVALAPLLAVAAQSTPRQAAGQFFLTGWLFHSLLLQWLWANIFWAGGWAVLGQQLLCLFLALHWAVVGFLWRYLSIYFRLFGFVLVSFLWFVMEWLMATWCTGFGWSALGYTQGISPVGQWAAFGRVEYISFLIVLVNALFAAGIRRPRWIGPAAAILLLGIAHGIGYRLAAPEAPSRPTPLRVGMVQPAFSQEIKWDSDFSEFMEKMFLQYSRSLCKASPVDLLVWPEAALPGEVEEAHTLQTLQELTRDTGAALFTGIDRMDRHTGEDFNSSALIRPEGQVAGQYDKVHLAPFGEYIPFDTWLPFLKTIAFGGVTPGKKQVVIDGPECRVGPLICFEVLFSPLAQALRRQGADLLVVITNLAWFGASTAIPQELEIARFRAIETRLPLVHCSNTGISGVFDPYGRFTPVHMAVLPDGRVTVYDSARIDPEDIQHRRMVGAFDVSAPASPPPSWILMAMVGLFVVLCLGEWKMETAKNKH